MKFFREFFESIEKDQLQLLIIPSVG